MKPLSKRLPHRTNTAHSLWIGLSTTYEIQSDIRNTADISQYVSGARGSVWDKKSALQFWLANAHRKLATLSYLSVPFSLINLTGWLQSNTHKRTRLSSTVGCSWYLTCRLYLKRMPNPDYTVLLHYVTELCSVFGRVKSAFPVFLATVSAVSGGSPVLRLLQYYKFFLSYSFFILFLLFWTTPTISQFSSSHSVTTLLTDYWKLHVFDVYVEHLFFFFCNLCFREVSSVAVSGTNLWLLQ